MSILGLAALIFKLFVALLIAGFGLLVLLVALSFAAFIVLFLLAAVGITGPLEMIFDGDR